jgi:hypothetical protein
VIVSGGCIVDMGCVVMVGNGIVKRPKQLDGRRGIDGRDRKDVFSALFI